EAAKTPLGCVPRLRHRGLGAHRQRRNLERYRRRELAQIWEGSSPRLLRRRRKEIRGIGARAVAWLSEPATRPRSSYTVLVQLLGESSCTDPGQGDPLGHASLEFGARE